MEQEGTAIYSRGSPLPALFSGEGEARVATLQVAQLNDRRAQEGAGKNMKTKLKPLGDHVLIKPIEEGEMTVGGVIIPEVAKEKPAEGVVVALGTGKTDEHGRKVPFEVKTGERVLLTKYGGTEVSFDEETYKIMSADDILAVVNEPRT
jgi:chaperonin GroES